MDMEMEMLSAALGNSKKPSTVFCDSKMPVKLNGNSGKPSNGVWETW